MENDITVRENDLLISKNGTEFQVPFEAVASGLSVVSQMGMEVVGAQLNAASQMINAKKEIVLGAVENEAKTQIEAMKCTSWTQGQALNEHERNQHDLLEEYKSNAKEAWARYDKAETLEEKNMILAQMQKDKEELSKRYLSNNSSLDSSLDKTKQKSKGILKHFVAWFR
jgi:vacuolar-type H+-ATPase subunit I/STV1